MPEAIAFWIDEPGVGVLRRQPVDGVGDGDVLVRTRFTGISRGTESSVFRGRVPLSEQHRMRAPFQEGDFPGPVKYGYLNVGVVEQGPTALLGRTVFTLFPHQSTFVVPADAVVAVPPGVPARRGVLAGAVETAVNVLWDAAPLVGDRVTIVGAGMIGCAIARVIRGIPGLDVLLVDVDASRGEIADRLGVRFAEPGEAPGDRDLVIHTSGSAAGLQVALESAVTDGEVIEASWYGDQPVSVMLGADFHSRRLAIRSSQVSAVALRRRGTRTTRDRLQFALDLLHDETFDVLLTGHSSWRDLPEVMAALAAGPSAELCHTIDWEDAV
ncbi:zinc-binding alcohol dehydrogenase [Herbiconiux sp. CPCC 205763]|uniref:Zinc-binding alcohol dehydrogenase n=1 Tax=Herbiconiux aconitum TaxID=2970913 RepID=A0ABT2GVG5_9MICO|nr:zinc-binding alcohol dehydrogenase [Herbiconiux aconitum]MCS5720204.1 zinc-binding alcohol dehydrogenase [Herbiconiux aconitum]